MDRKDQDENEDEIDVDEDFHAVRSRLDEDG